MATPVIGDQVTLTLTGVVTKRDDTRGPQFLVELHRPDMPAPTRRQLWIVEDELEEESPPIVATTATAGIPGTFGPDGCVIPADFAAMQWTVDAVPDTSWQTGEYVNTADGQPASWDGVAWGQGIQP